MIRVLDDFSSSAFAAFEVDVLQRGESKKKKTLLMMISPSYPNNLDLISLIFQLFLS